jgi:hypothetical protein
MKPMTSAAVFGLIPVPPIPPSGTLSAETHERQRRMLFSALKSARATRLRWPSFQHRNASRFAGHSRFGLFRPFRCLWCPQFHADV